MEKTIRTGETKAKTLRRRGLVVAMAAQASHLNARIGAMTCLTLKRWPIGLVYLVRAMLRSKEMS